MLAILTPTQKIDCDQCGRPSLYVNVTLADQAFVSQLCPMHLAVFLQNWMDYPKMACDQLKGKRPVKADQ